MLKKWMKKIMKSLPGSVYKQRFVATGFLGEEYIGTVTIQNGWGPDPRIKLLCELRETRPYIVDVQFLQSS